MKQYLRELLGELLGSRGQSSHLHGGKHRQDTASLAVSFLGMVPWEQEQMAPQESCFRGNSVHPNQLLAVCCTQQIFSFQHNLVVKDMGSLKLGIGSLVLYHFCLATSLLQEEARVERMETHQLGAFVSAISCEDEGVLARGNGHHRCVDQAQLHDAGIVASQGGRVVETDPRGVAATWQVRG